MVRPIKQHMAWFLAMANAQSDQQTRSITILGIESSCDDTAAAVVVNAGGKPNVLSSIVSSQDELHAAYGGVVPEIAARAHAERVDLCVEKAILDADISLSEIDAIAVTAGPGLIGGVLSGVMAAKGLAAGLNKPLIGVNHLAGHALTPRMTDNLPYPYLMLLVSGGHCQFLAVLGHDNFVRMGGTIDDAPGEAFDKTAKLLGLGYPGGPMVEKEALSGDAKRFKFPRPLLNRPGCDMSFSGLKTALRRARDELVLEKGGITQKDLADLCASFQTAVADTLAEKSRRALIEFQDRYDLETGHFAVAGGVAANMIIRGALDNIVANARFNLVVPPLRFCTDNAAMIAWAGSERFLQNQFDGFDLVALPRWPLDQNAAPMLGSGKRGAKA